MKLEIQSRWLRYGLAFGIFAVILGFSLVLRRYEIKINFTIPIILGLVASAWYGGRGPGFFYVIVLVIAAVIIGGGSSESSTAAVIFGYVSALLLLLFVAWLVSGRKAASANNARLRRQNELILNSAGEGIIGLDADGKCTFVNPAAEKMLGWSAEELKARPLHETVHQMQQDGTGCTEAECPIQTVHEFGHGKRISDDIFFTKAGTSFPVEYTYTPVWEDGKQVGAVIVVRDITERKKAEADLRELNESLEHRVSVRTRQLEAANKELESFSYSVSHDLRAPLRAIDGFSRMFSEDYADKLDDEGKRLHGVIRANTQKMGQLIDDLLAFSRLGLKPVDAAPIDMDELAHSVTRDLQSEEKTPIQFTIAPLPAVPGDRALMRQVFVNLFSNAVKYSRTKNSIEIEVGSRNDNGEVVYFIRDQGVGFDMKYSDKLFGVFQRLHSQDQFEGTGVGLAIVQRIVQRHGGRVWAEAEVGRGATFYFALPKDGVAADLRMAGNVC